MTTTPQPRRHLSLAAERDLRVRLADAGDQQRLRRLAALDSALPLTGEVLLAELDGTVVAALSLDDGKVVADPFVPTEPVLDVLAMRAAALRPDGGRAGAWRRVTRLAPARLRPV